MVTNFAFMITAFVYLQVKNKLDDTSPQTLCTSPFFITMSAGGEIITLMFFIVGIIITIKVKKITRVTKYEVYY